MLRKFAYPATLALALGALIASPADAGTATGTTAVKTQLQASPKITGGKTILWIPAKTKLTLQCLAVGEKAYGAVAKADPYYYKVTYKGKTGYAIDADLYTSKSATALGLKYCSDPEEPRSPKASSVTSSSVKLSWVDKSNNETRFKTQYSTNGGKSWKAGASTSANKTSVTVTGLKPSTKYILQVGAYNNHGTKWSAWVRATTKKTSATADPGYRLPFPKGKKYYITNDGPGHQSWLNANGYASLTPYNKHAVDFAMKRGETVSASRAGTVRKVNLSGGDVIIDHGSNRCTRYAHMNTVLVKKGQKVKQGQKVGGAGNKGLGNGGVHLHWVMIYCDSEKSREYVNTKEMGRTYRAGTWSAVSQNG